MTHTRPDQGPSSEPAVEAREVTLSDVVAWLEEDALASETFVATVRREGLLVEEYGSELDAIEERARMNRGAAASLRQLMEENAKMRRALEVIASADDGFDREDFHIGVARRALSPALETGDEK